MAILSTTEAGKINYSDVDAQAVGLGDRIRETEVYGLCVLTGNITSAANSTALSIAVPFDCEIVDVVVQARATSGSGTATLRVGTDAITNAIVMATDTNVTRAGTIDDSKSVLTAGDSLNVITNGATDRGLVSVFVRRT